MFAIPLCILADETSSGTSSTSALNPSTQLIVIVIGITVLAFTVLGSKFRRRRADPLDRSDGGSSLSQQRSVERQMQNLLVELSEMSRQITAQLDTRSLKLETLLREADEKIARLESIGTHQPPGVPSNNGPYGFSSVVQQADLPPRPVEVSNLAPAPEVDSRHLEIYSLADQGRSVHDIASQLSRPTGEIELILALRPRR